MLDGFIGGHPWVEGKMVTPISLIASRSIAGDINFYDGKTPYTGKIDVVQGK